MTQNLGQSPIKRKIVLVPDMSWKEIKDVAKSGKKWAKTIKNVKEV